MGKIVIKRNGLNHLSLVERNKRTINSASQNKVILSDDSVTIRVQSNSVLDIKINDTFEVYGDVYRINQMPSVTKSNETSYEYDIVGQGLMFDLLRCKFFNADGTGFKTTREFPLVGTIEVFLLALKANMQRLSANWEIGNFTNGETKTITFSDDTCLSALQKICQEFKTEFWVKAEGGKFKIHTGNFGSTLPQTLQYGKGKGLYNLSRKNVNENGIINRLYVDGGTQNIPANYRGFSDRLKFSDAGYIEDAALIAEHGLKEGSIVFDDIYPRRTGKVTDVEDEYTFYDDTMDFDLNEKEADGITTKYLVAGQTAKVHFNTGNLAGYEFEVSKYSSSSKSFTIIPFKNEQNYEIPNIDSAAFQFAVGDEYVLLDIVMPQTYITNAETQLQTKGNEQFALLKQAKVSYDLNVAEDFLKTLATPLQIGDMVRVVDSALGIDKTLRVNQITRNFIQNGEANDYDYKIVIADSYEVAFASKLLLDIQDIRNVVNVQKIDQIRLSKIGLRITEELKESIFDPDGKLDTSIIRENSIEANMIAVGSRSQAISTNLIFRTNVGNNANSVSGDAFRIYSQTFEKEWNLSAFSQVIPDNNLRYVYAKVSKTGTNGTIHITTAKITFDSDPNDYYILLGMLSSVVEGVRVFVPTYGMTTITGGLIRTGIISSNDGQTQFNLNTGEITGRITFLAGSTGYNNLKDKPDLTSVYEARNYVNNTLPTELQDLKNRADGVIESWFYSHTPNLTNLPAFNWTTDEDRDKHIGDTFTNMQEFVDDETTPDAGKAWRFAKNPDGSYSWNLIANSDSTKALIEAGKAKDTADAKRRVFVTQPFPPYDTGDLWAQGEEGELMRCVATRLSGVYVASDWEKATKYTDDTAVKNFIAVTYKPKISDLQGQIDGKIESWFQVADPSSSWTTAAMKSAHVGDMWYNSNTKELKRYNASYTWELVEDKKAIDAYTLAGSAKDTADGKRRVFVSQPTTSDVYDIGDLWVNATVGDYVNEILRAQTGKTSGTPFNVSHWVKSNKYTDDSRAIAAEISAKDYADGLKSQIDDEIAELNGELSTLQTNVSNLPIGALTETALFGIKQQKNIVQSEYNDVYSRYVIIRDDAFLKDKTALNDAYGTETSGYLKAYNDLFDYFDTAFNDGAITQDEKNTLNGYFTAYKSALATFSEAMQTALKTIEQARIDGIQIGGRNLALNSAQLGLGGNDYQGSDNSELGVIKIHSSGNWNCYAFFNISAKPKVGDYHTFSIELNPTSAISVSFNYMPYYDAHNFIKTEQIPANVWTKVFVTGQITTTNQSTFLIGMTGSNSAGVNLRYRNIKIESGNKATDWTPAPEDVEQMIQDQQIYIEYSADATNWHLGFQTGDLYMRQKKGSGAWSNAIRIVGEKGAAGAEGRYTDFQFAKNTSTTTPPTTGWQDAPPTTTEGEFVWMRSGEVIPPATTPTTWTPATRITGVKGEKGDQGLQGLQGQKGDQGVPGAKGADGQTTYFHIKYAPVQNPTASQMSETPDVFIGTYVDFTPADSNDPTKYKWSRFQGLKGDQGIKGEDGENGTTYYLHIAYADTATGGGFSQDPTGKSYIGTYTDTIEQDSPSPSAYTWAKFRGEPITSNTQPPNPYSGMVWIDTSLNPPQQKIWDGAKWVVVNDVQIGGRNLLKNSSNFRESGWNGGITNYGGGYVIDSSLTYLGKPTLKTILGPGLVHDWIKLENNEVYTYSALVYGDSEIEGNYNVPLHYWAGYNNQLEGKIQIIDYDTFIEDNKWKLIYLTFKLTSNADSFRPFFYRGVGNTEVWVAYFKLEKGNKATDWTPAPEDVVAGYTALVNQEIADVEGKITGLETTVNGAFKDGIIEEAEAKAIEKYINSLNAEKADVSAKYTTTVNDINLIDKTPLQTAWSNYDKSHGDLISIINSAISDGKTTATEKGAVDLQFGDYKNKLAALSTAFENAFKAIEQKRIDNVQIGGRNYFRDGKFNNGYWGFGEVYNWDSIYPKITSTNIDSIPPPNGGNVVSAFSANSGDHYFYFDKNIPVKPNTEYTLVFYFSSAGSIIGNSSYYYGVQTGSYYGLNFDSMTFGSWVKKEVKFNSYNNTEVKIRFGLSSTGACWLSVAEISLQTGNKLIDWTPAPEDVEAAISAAQAAANTANTKLSEIASDSILSASEKQQTKKEWDIIQSEKATVESQASAVGVSAAAYTGAYTALEDYITPLLNDLNTNSAIDGTVFRAKFKNYYDAKIALLKAVTDKLNTKVGDVQAAQNSITSQIAAINDKTDWMSPTVDPNINAIMAGTLAVGNPTTGVNALMTGLGGANDIFLAAGFTNILDLAGGRVWIKRNGHFKFKTDFGLEFDSENNHIVARHTNGVVGIKLGIVNGNPEMAFYKSTGEKVYALGEGGIYYVSEIAESYNPTFLKLISTNTDNALAERSVSPSDSTTAAFNNDVFNSVCSSSGYKQIRGTNNAWVYSAGQNAYSESNRQYEGYKSSGTVKTANVTNGWYAEAQYLIDGLDHNSFVKLNLIINGKITKTFDFPVNGNPSSFPTCS